MVKILIGGIKYCNRCLLVTASTKKREIVVNYILVLTNGAAFKFYRLCFHFHLFQNFHMFLLAVSSSWLSRTSVESFRHNSVLKFTILHHEACF